MSLEVAPHMRAAMMHCIEKVVARLRVKPAKNGVSSKGNASSPYGKAGAGKKVVALSSALRLEKACDLVKGKG